MSSMLIVDIVDKHGGFRAVTGYIRTANKRKLLWYISIATFFFSALLDNLAAAIVIMAVLRKLVPDRTDRLKYACMVIIAANAGGSWSPIGDVTTILLWVGKNITAMHQISHVFISALVNMLVPLTIAHFWLFKKDSQLRVMSEEEMADRVCSRNIEPGTAYYLCDRCAITGISPCLPDGDGFTSLPGLYCWIGYPVDLYRYHV